MSSKPPITMTLKRRLKRSRVRRLLNISTLLTLSSSRENLSVSSPKPHSVSSSLLSSKASVRLSAVSTQDSHYISDLHESDLTSTLGLSAFGIDYGVISGVVALPQFRAYFGIPASENGGRWGIIVASIYIGNFVASAFVWLSDIIGRRGVTFLGSVITIIGAIIQVTAPNYVSLIIGRLFTGGGGALTATVAPLYMSEVAPACWRGLVVGLNASWGTIGGIIISCILLGSSYIESDWSWRMPLLVQIVAPLIVCILVYPLTPESPRYLMYKGKETQAREILAKYHTTSEDVNSPLVNEEIKQIKDSLALMDRKPMDFSPLWKTKPDRYRLFLIFLYSLFQQWNGSNLFSYYLPAVLTLVGITDPHSQLGFNLGQSLAGWLANIVGATIFDRLRRRTLLMTGMGIFVLFLVLISICSSQFALHGSKGVGYLIIVWVYMFDICNGLTGMSFLPSINSSSFPHYSFSNQDISNTPPVTSMHSIYPNEVLHYTQRAKGMGMYSLFQACFGIVMTYGVSAAMAKIGWKIYFVFIFIDLAAIALTYQFFPEFRFLSLEEIDLVFETPGTHPVALSKKLQKAKKEKRAEGSDEGNVESGRSQRQTA
jgi:MFS family permease